MSLPFPCTDYLDLFNRPDGPLGANWHDDSGIGSGLRIDGMEVAVEVGHDQSASEWNTIFGPNCEARITITDWGVDSASVSIFARYNDTTGTGYEFIITNAGGVNAQLFANGVLIASTTVIIANGDQYGIRLCSTTITVWQNPGGAGWSAIPILTTINPTITSAGYIGLQISGSVDSMCRLGNFGGGDVDYECCGITPPPVTSYGVPPVRTPGFYQQTGLSIIATDPLLAANRSTWFSRLADQIQTFRMEKRRIGGYWSADANINMRSDEVEDWIERGLGRHIQVVDEALCQVWEGFVNRIEAKLGKLTFTLGPLMDGANRVQVDYSTIDNSVSPPILGIPASTTPVDDLSSQAVYGIIQKILSTGGSTAAEAAQVGNTYLAEHAWPPTGRQSTLLGGAAGDLTIEMLGYWAWLSAYVYNQTAATGSVNASAKLQAVLAAQPNAGLFSTDYARITANTVQVSQWEDEDRTAEDVVKSINALGTTTYATTNVGFYNGRQIVYEPAPTSIRYVQRVASNDLLTDLIGGRVQPWNVMPGEWIFYADFLAGRLPPVTGTAIQRDPRCGLIEVVTLDNRYGLDINGVHVGTLDQMLARQGLAGVGA